METKKPLILIVDDIPRNLQVLGNILQKYDCEIAIAAGGNQALSIVNNIVPDLILLDVMMPDINGFDVCVKIKEMHPEEDIPIIFLTAKTETKDVVRGFEIGAVDYVTKPFNGTELISRVDTHISLRRARMEQKRINKELEIEIQERKKAEEKVTNLYESLLEDLKTASIVQSYLVPSGIVHYNGVMFNSFYSPSTDVGGDSFDIIQVEEDKYYVYMADISGHGVQAALLMTAVNSLLRIMIEQKHDKGPQYIMEQFNKIAMEKLFNHTRSYMTMILGVVDTKEKTFSYCNAGHPPVIAIDILTKEVQTIMDMEGSIPVGWKQNYKYSDDKLHVIDLSCDKYYFLYTDGLTECTAPDGSELDIDGLEQYIKKNCNSDNKLMMPQKLKSMLVKDGYQTESDDFSIMTFSLFDDNFYDKTLIQQIPLNTYIIKPFVLELMNFLEKQKYPLGKTEAIMQVYNKVVDMTMERIRHSVTDKKVTVMSTIVKDKFSITILDFDENPSDAFIEKSKSQYSRFEDVNVFTWEFE